MSQPAIEQYKRTRPVARVALALLIGAMSGAGPAFAALSIERIARASVVKVYSTIQHENYQLPWQGGRSAAGTGSGFVIHGRRILTNAHVVSDVRFLQVQKDSDPRRFHAKVLFIGHDCDLAVLEVDDASFFEGTRPVRFASALPKLNDVVTALGISAWRRSTVGNKGRGVSHRFRRLFPQCCRPASCSAG